MKATKNIERKIRALSPSLMDELDRYLDYLLQKRDEKIKPELKQDWAGDLKDCGYTSLDLQKKALDWRQK